MGLLSLMFKRHSLKKRWMLTSVVITLAIAVLGAGAWSIAIYSYYNSGIRTALESKAKASADFFASYITMTYAEYYQSAYRYAEKFEDRDVLELQFLDSGGRVQISTYGLAAGTYPDTPDIASAISNKSTQTYRGRSPTTGERIISVSSPMLYSNGQVVGVMRYISGLGAVDRVVATNVLAGAGVALAVVLIVMLLNLFFIRGIVAPIREVTRITKRIAEGGYGGQIDLRSDDEIGEMVTTINDMSMRLSQSEKMKTGFISSVSHELRTPLTAIAGWSETVLYDDTLSQDSRTGVGIILKESRRLTNMVEELLDFTRIEDGRFFVNIEPMDIENMVEDAVITYGEMLRMEGMDLVYEPSAEPLPQIPGDGGRLKQVVLNILDNAAKYGRDGKRIDVRIGTCKPEGKEKEMVEIAVRDYGPGVPEDELDKIKLKFYKGRSKERGSGIGLAVCDEIIRLHNGILKIENAPKGGLLVRILLPMK